MDFQIMSTYWNCLKFYIQTFIKVQIPSRKYLFRNLKHLYCRDFQSVNVFLISLNQN